MKHYRPALSWRQLTNCHGAVFLLSVYFASLTLLILSGVAIQRTMLESRAAQVSRDNAQAFYLADGAIDYALTELKTHELADGDYNTTNTPVLPAGAQFTLSTVQADVVDPQTQQLVREIRAIGTSASGSQAQAVATITQQGPLTGIWTEGPVDIYGGILGDGVVTGDLRSGLGTLASILFTSIVRHSGNLQIGPSSPTAQTYGVSISPVWWYYNPQTPPWNLKIGAYPDLNGGVRKPGVMLAWNPHAPGAQPSTEASVAVGPVSIGSPIAVPYPVERCQGTITQATSSTVTEITDGHPLDLTGPGDGRIEVCVQYVSSPGSYLPMGAIVFRAPTKLYVTGSFVPPSWDSTPRYSVNATNLYAVTAGRNYQNAPLIPNGLQIYVTQPLPDQVTGNVRIGTNRFSGSIHAPASEVTFFTRTFTGFSTEPTAEVEFQSITARQAHLMINHHTVVLGGNRTKATMSTQPNTSLLSWTAE
ncbi:MAG: hypothetical protein Q8R91_06315 [Candidatus Omnitrophota bacterium]|nr:hypothetical protein [Candidatus Omnitrophota bacterium]